MVAREGTPLGPTRKSTTAAVASSADAGRTSGHRLKGSNPSAIRASLMSGAGGADSLFGAVGEAAEACREPAGAFSAAPTFERAASSSTHEKVARCQPLMKVSPLFPVADLSLFHLAPKPQRFAVRSAANAPPARGTSPARVLLRNTQRRAQLASSSVRRNAISAAISRSSSAGDSPDLRLRGASEVLTLP